jgi:hypothetical protein
VRIAISKLGEGACYCETAQPRDIKAHLPRTKHWIAALTLSTFEIGYDDLEDSERRVGFGERMTHPLIEERDVEVGYSEV